MKKDFLIYDCGKVRRCEYNISKMNIFEVIYFRIFEWKYISTLISSLFESLIELLQYALVFIVNLICLILFPIVIIIDSYRLIKVSKKICKEK